MSRFGWSYPPGAANDPFAPYNQQEDYTMDCDELRDALKGHDTGRWEWEKIDCTLTGKDADLEPWGDQGIEVVSCDDEGVKCVAHILKTFAGTDVCLNLEPEIANGPDARIHDCHEAYMEQAQEVVAGCDVPGEWDGDDWVMADKVDFAVEWSWADEADGVPDYEATAAAVVAKATEVLADVEQELVLADQILDRLAGWTDGEDENGEPIRCKAGEPGSAAAWRGRDDDEEGA